MEQPLKVCKKNTFWRGVLTFALGCLCFIVSQPLTRFPLLGYLQGTVAVTVFSQTSTVLFLMLVALSAGVFEEGFRFLFKTFLLRPAKAPFSQPLLFGLGHGLTEAAIILVSAFLQGYTLGDLWLGIIERFLAVICQVCMTVIVFNGFQIGRRWLYLLFAVLVHGLVDFVLPLMALSGISALIVEAAFVVMLVPLVIYAARSKKYYSKGEIQNA